MHNGTNKDCVDLLTKLSQGRSAAHARSELQESRRRRTWGLVIIGGPKIVAEFHPVYTAVGIVGWRRELGGAN